MKYINWMLIAAIAITYSTSVNSEDRSGWQRHLEAAELLEISEKQIAPLKGKFVVVTFFASWCPPCKDEFAHLNRMIANKDDRTVVVVGVNVFENWGGKANPERMERFVTQSRPRFALVRGSPETRALFGNIERIPSLIVFDKAGREVWRFVHERGSAKTFASESDISRALKLAGHNQ